MPDFINLLGAEDVRSAASTMTRAASQMQSTASQIDEALQRHQQFLSDWLTDFEDALDRISKD